MRKVIMWNMVTLDGYFEGPDHDISWFVFDDEIERYILDTQEDADTLLFGRVTYQMMADYWPTAEGRIADFMNRVQKFVFSRTLGGADWNNSTLIKEDAPGEVARLKQQPGKDIFLFGSANFASTLDGARADRRVPDRSEPGAARPWVAAVQGRRGQGGAQVVGDATVQIRARRPPLRAVSSARSIGTEPRCRATGQGVNAQGKWEIRK